MIQLLGIRPWRTPQGEERKIDTFHDRNWKAPSVAELFSNVEKYLKPVPEADRWNLYYTAAECTSEKRKLLVQKVIPFDIDGIQITPMVGGSMPFAEAQTYIDVVCAALGIKPDETGIVFSGNGLQFLVGLTDELSITSEDFFKNERVHYRALCNRINLGLAKAKLPGSADPSVFSPARLLRLPETHNRKPGKPERMAKLIQGHVVPVVFDIRTRSGIPVVGTQDQVTPDQLKRYPRADGEGVLEGCSFLQHCKSDPNSVTEPQWYAMLSIAGRLPDGTRIAHELSQGHRSYNHAETEEKLEQALSVSGPRTCENINQLWGKCSTCPNFQKVNSPISIRGENYIKTLDSGFHDILIDKQGNAKVGKPNYEDLRKFFEQSNPYVVLGGSRICYTWHENHYKELEDAYIENFAQVNFVPTAVTVMVTEFRNLVQRTNIKDPRWFTETTERRINFANGVLDLETLRFHDGPDPDLGFRSVLGYAFDPEARCPTFDRFMQDITCGDPELESILLEYAGYALGGDSCWAAKALVLDGTGSNGKSTFMNVLRGLAGQGNYSSLTLSELRNEGNRQMIDGKLFNMAEETPSRSLMESSLFKNLVTGGETQVRMIYKKPYTMRNKAKLIFACNELPDSLDATQGFFRRFIIVPFKAVFSKEAGNLDPFIEKKLLSELPGIFNRVIRAYGDLHRRGGFVASEKAAIELEKYKRDVDSVLRWFEAQCTVTEATSEHVAWIKDLYANYAQFIESEGEKPLTAVHFGRRLNQIIPEYKARLKHRHEKERAGRVLHGVTYREFA